MIIVITCKYYLYLSPVLTWIHWRKHRNPFEFVTFIDIDMARVVEILPRERQCVVHLAKSMRGGWWHEHYSDVITSVEAVQITRLTIVYSTVYSGEFQRKHPSYSSLTVVRGIHRWPVNSPHNWPVTRKMFPFDDVIMEWAIIVLISLNDVEIYLFKLPVKLNSWF